MESFHSRVRDELLDIEELLRLAEARVVTGDWQEDYNLQGPYAALWMNTPAVFAALILSQLPHDRTLGARASAP